MIQPNFTLCDTRFDHDSLRIIIIHRGCGFIAIAVLSIPKTVGELVVVKNEFGAQILDIFACAACESCISKRIVGEIDFPVVIHVRD